MKTAKTYNPSEAPATGETAVWTDPALAGLQSGQDVGFALQIVAVCHCRQTPSGAGIVANDEVDLTNTLEERAAGRRRSIEVRVFRPGSPDVARLREIDEEYWLRIPLDERMGFAHQLSLDQWRMRGWDPDHSPRLSRSLGVIRRK